MQIESEIPRLLGLHDLADASPHVEPLGPADDAEILRFFDNAGMGGKIRLLMQRKPRFHDLVDQRGGISRVLGLRDFEGRLIGTGALSSTPCFIGGRPGHFAYMSDLRIQTRDKVLREEWRDLFGRIMKSGPALKEVGENGRMICVIIESNHRAIKVLKESVHNGQRLVRLAPYSMITLFKRVPWRRRPASPEYRVEQGGTLEELEQFLHSVHKDQAFGQCFASPHFELRRRLATWKGLSLKDFYSVRDSAGRIVATTALWNPNHCKQSVVEGPWWTKIYNWLAKPLSLPEFGKPMEIVYLTHLTLAWNLSAQQREDVFALLMDRVWSEKRKRKAHALAYCDFKEHSLAGALQGYVKVPVNVGMYIVMPAEQEAGFDRTILGKFPPAFELALV